jgi:hypothetical protein
VTLNGSTISQITDKSGNGRTFLNGTAVNQPAQTTLNGRNAANVDSTSKWLQADFTLTHTAQTVVCVGQANAAVSSFARLYSQATASSETPTGGYIPLIRNSNASPLQMVSYTNSFLGPVSFTAGTTTVFTARHSGSAFTVRANAVSGAAQNHTLNIQFTRQRYGNGFSGADGFRGIFGDCLMWTRALSDAELSTVERWLASKWGATLAPTVTNADAQAWINNVYLNGGTVSTATANAVNTFCNDIESAGIRDRFYRLNLFAGTGLSAALVPLFRGPSLGGTQTGNTTDTNVGPFVSGDYSETVGLTSNSDTKHLRTGLNLNAMDAFTTGHFMAAIGAYPGAVQYPIGAVDGSDRYLLQLRTDRAFWGSTTPTSPASNNLISANGMALMTRESATALTLYNGSTSVGTVTSSITPAGGNAEVYVYRTDESVGSFPAYVGNMRAYSIGRAMTSAQVASLYTAMQSLQTSLGRTQA